MSQNLQPLHLDITDADIQDMVLAEEDILIVSDQDIMDILTDSDTEDAIEVATEEASAVKSLFKFIKINLIE